MTDEKVIQQCGNCKHINVLSVEDTYGTYKSYTCKKYKQVVSKFPVFTAAFHGELIVASSAVNHCRHFTHIPTRDK
jgi:hypothetical protein